MEPIFRAILSDDEQVVLAHSKCANTIFEFVEMVSEGSSESYMAKLRFRDPDLSEKEGSDCFFYLWLSDVLFHPKENLLSGVFFEVPEGFEKWHHVGKRLGFEPEDVFDWMVIDSGHMKGGFTIRLTRERLANEAERQEYDKYIGVNSYEAI